jgi:hypothetical protein
MVASRNTKEVDHMGWGKLGNLMGRKKNQNQNLSFGFNSTT